MKKKIWIILAAIFVVVVLTMAVAGYIISQKITPDEVRKVALSQMKNTFPHADAELGKIDISLGLNIGLVVKKLHLFIPNNVPQKSNLFSVEDVNIKIPIWSLVFGGGTVEVEINKPRISYREYVQGNNWQFAMQKVVNKTTAVNSTSESSASPSGQPSSKQSSSEQSKIFVPGFLSGVKLDFKLSDLRVNYLLKGEKKDSFVEVSKLKVKNLNFKTPTAIEIDSYLDFEKKASFALRILGELNLKQLVDKNTLPANFRISLTDIKLAQISKKLPEVITEIKVRVNTVTNDIEGSFKTDIGDGASILAASYHVDGQANINISDIDIQLLMQQLVDLMDVKNDTINVGKSKFVFSGSISMEQQKIKPNFKFNLTPELHFNYHGLSGVTGFSGEFKDKSLSVVSNSKLLEGSVILLFKSVLDLNQKKIDIARLQPFNLDVNIQNLKIAREVMNKLMYADSSKKKDNQSIAARQSEVNAGESKNQASVSNNKRTPIVLPPGVVNLDIKEVMLASERFAGTGKFVISNNTLETQKLDFKLGDGVGQVRHTSTFASSGDINNKFQMNLKNIKFESFSVFMPPSAEKISGQLIATVTGKADLGNTGSVKYDVSADVTARNGEISGLNLKEYLDGYLSKVPVLNKQTSKKIDISDGFEHILLKGRFTDVLYTFEKIDFKGVQNKIAFNGSGRLIPPPLKKEGAIILEYVDQLGISNTLEANVGTKILPIKLAGEGFSLKPDYSYTIGKLAKGAVTKQGSNLLKKVLKGKSGDNPINNLLKGEASPLKGLFGQ